MVFIYLSSALRPTDHCLFYLSLVLLNNIFRSVYCICVYAALFGVIQIELGKVAMIAMYCHLGHPGAIAFPLQQFWGLQIWAADENNAVSFKSRCGARC